MIFYRYTSNLAVRFHLQPELRKKVQNQVLNYGLATYVTKLRYQPYLPSSLPVSLKAHRQFNASIPLRHWPFLRFFDPENLYPKLNIKNRSSMATQITKRLISLLLALLLVSSTLASSDAPFIVAHKKATVTRLKPGIERVSVSIDIYNQGSAWVRFYHFAPSADISRSNYSRVLQSISFRYLYVGFIMGICFG